jgi:2,3-bisphosphoglycerate-dependent phosphoglycerate mutase
LLCGHVNVLKEQHKDPTMKIFVLIVSFATTVSTFVIPKTFHSATTALLAKENEDFDSYSRCLTAKEERESVLDESQQYAIIDKDRKRRFRRWRPKRKRARKPGVLILLLTGHSTFHADDIFTGWADPPLTEEGVMTCQHAARLLVAEGLQNVDVVYTSRLTRAIRSAQAVLEEWDALYLPMRKTWRLNGRHYGAVTGLSKQSVAETFGTSVVQAWRNSLKARPPPLPLDDPASPAQDRRYADLVVTEDGVESLLPTSESSLDCQERARPVWEYRIRQHLRDGENVMIVAHRDSLRGIIQQVEGGSIEDPTQLMIPTGVPIVYRFDRKLNPLFPEDDEDRRMPLTSAVFLEKPGLLKKALERQQAWRNRFSSGSEVGPDRSSTVERALWTLRREQALTHSEPEGTHKTESITNQTTTTISSEKPSQETEQWWDDVNYDDEFAFFAGSSSEKVSWQDDFELDDEEIAIKGDENLTPSMNIMSASSADSYHPQDDPVIVFVRHGRTPHNNMGLFTGWEDPPLAKEGVEDAKRAGRLLKRHGFEFDVAYTSQLTRAIKTASYILEELDTLWIPLIKSWRLNERMYGALTGKSKKMIETEYGKEQLIRWRRGYKIRPPAVSSFSYSYPGNDEQRTKNVRDLPIAWSETIARSLERRRFVLHRRFPKTESLHDCMKRSIPFYTDRIVREAVNKNKRVLIASHENAIRGILMHLCDIPEPAMRQLHLPNGLPLVYSVKGKCITLLEDDLDDDVPKISMDDFGPASKYLFQPCQLDDDFFESMEAQATMMNNELKQNEQKTQEQKKESATA